MKLGPFISGIFGTLGFGLSVLAGIATGNTIDAILLHALASAAICYTVGYFAGVIAQQVALEHAAHLSKIVATQDAQAETQRLEEQARQDAEAAANAETTAAAVAATPSAALENAGKKK